MFLTWVVENLQAEDGQNITQKDPYIYPKWRKAEVSLIQRKIFYGNLNVISANETASFRFLREIFL